MLKAEGRRFPGTAVDIALEAFGREEDRQAIYKNPHIKKVHKGNLAEVGQDTRSMKVDFTKEQALENRADQLDSAYRGLQEKVDLLTAEKAALLKRVHKLERDLECARRSKSEATAAIDHLFETGRRVLL